MTTSGSPAASSTAPSASSRCGVSVREAGPFSPGVTVRTSGFRYRIDAEGQKADYPPTNSLANEVRLVIDTRVEHLPVAARIRQCCVKGARGSFRPVVLSLTPAGLTGEMHVRPSTSACAGLVQSPRPVVRTPAGVAGSRPADRTWLQDGWQARGTVEQLRIMASPISSSKSRLQRRQSERNGQSFYVICS